MVEILDVMWFSGRDTVGIVRVNVPHEGIKYYIGTGKGMNAEADKQHIADWGDRFPNRAGDVLFGADQYHYWEDHD